MIAASVKNKATAGKVNMEELVGNTDGFADSGSVMDKNSSIIDVHAPTESALLWSSVI